MLLPPTPQIPVPRGKNRNAERILGHEHRTQLVIGEEDAVCEHKVVQGWVCREKEDNV